MEKTNNAISDFAETHSWLWFCQEAWDIYNKFANEDVSFYEFYEMLSKPYEIK